MAAVALRLGMDPIVFLAAEGMERSVREAVTAEAERNRQEEIRAVLEAVRGMLGVRP